ncbi:MAG: peptidylprolyl isomerase [Planctomycetota bacterium]
MPARRGHRRCLLLAVLSLAACAGGPQRLPPLGGGDGTRGGGRDPLPDQPPVIAAPQPPRFAEGLGPEILLPDPAAGDAEVARVGSLVLRQSHAYTRLLSAHPKLALSAVDLLVFDVLVARHAEQYGIRVSEARVEELASEEERELRRQVQAELEGVTFVDYVWRLFGMREGDWQAALRLRTAQRLYQGYVLRYLALREDRVQVRFLVHKDRKVAQEVVDKVRVGADFATLALRWSEDPSRRDGGLLPAFGEGFRHPAATHAFELQAGEVCEPFEATWGGEQRWFVVYCLEHRPGRDVPFEQVRAEIDADLEQQPISPLETTAYTMRWRNEEERKSQESGK